MAEILDEAVSAPKIFFLSPDPFVVTDTFLETAFFMSYECYAVPETVGIDLKTRVKVIVETYSEVLLFFTIKMEDSLDYWVRFLGTLQKDHSATTRIGILYDKRIPPERDSLIKQLFLFEIGINAGSIALHVSAKENQALLLKVLAANQAAGRRKAIRMKGDPNFRVNFLLSGAKVEADMADLSISHFSVQFSSADPGWEVGTKIRNIQFSLGGILVTVNAMVALKRFIQGKPIFVFVFDAVNDHRDLLRAKINQFIFVRYQNEIMTFLKNRFQQE